jgi:hypothetical protein
VRLVLAVALAAGALGAVPATAGGNDWGTWTFTGALKSWSGTLVDAHRIQGVTIGTRSLPKYNSITSFVIGGKSCPISSSHGDAYCYGYRIPANRKVKWRLTTRMPLTSSTYLVPCIEWNNRYHCRYGNG